MKKIFKSIVASLLLVFTVTCFAGCGKTKSYVSCEPTTAFQEVKPALLSAQNGDLSRCYTIKSESVVNIMGMKTCSYSTISVDLDNKQFITVSDEEDVKSLTYFKLNEQNEGTVYVDNGVIKSSYQFNNESIEDFLTLNDFEIIGDELNVKEETTFEEFDALINSNWETTIGGDEFNEIFAMLGDMNTKISFSGREYKNGNYGLVINFAVTGKLTEAGTNYNLKIDVEMEYLVKDNNLIGLNMNLVEYMDDSKIMSVTSKNEITNFFASNLVPSEEELALYEKQ